MGVISVSREACMGKLRDKPLIKSNWFKAMAAKEHNTRAIQSFLVNEILLGLKRNMTQNKTRQTPTLMMFMPRGPAI
jgi:hypothetical protein